MERRTGVRRCVAARPAPLALLVALASCTRPDGDGASAVIVTDSAGVEIVFSATPGWGPEDRWRTSEVPALEIGAASGDEAYTLYGVRAAVRLDDGRIVIANQGTAQVRVYDAEGRHLADWGRRGEGPGEFQLLADVWRAPGDSIVAADNRLGRLTVFDHEGRVGRTIPLQHSGTPGQRFGRRTFSDGTLLVSSPIPPSEPPRPGLFDGGVRHFDRHTADGAHLNTIGALPHGRNWGFDRGGGPFGFAYTSAPFTIFSPPNAADDETIFLGDGTSPEVGQWSPDGALLRVIRWGVEPRAVTADVRDGYRDLELDGATTPEQRQGAEAMLDGIVFPDRLPVYESLMTDAEGFLWVRRYVLPWEDGEAWWVFDPSGRWLGQATLPDGLTPLDIGADYILGSTRDDLGVERVLLFGLDRSPGR